MRVCVCVRKVVCDLEPMPPHCHQLQGQVSELLEQLGKEKEAKEHQAGVLSQQLTSMNEMEEERKQALTQQVRTHVLLAQIA